ncbi:MAG: efflux RND transporter permease subunit [Burkholderiales bacterium]
MSRFNLSEWALGHRSLVLYIMAALAVIGATSYTKLGQSEDPPFTFKIMLIRTLWPGATAREMEQQVTDKIEKKVQEAPHVDRVMSFSKPGESVVFFFVKDSAPASDVQAVWYQLRKKIGDIRGQLPNGIQGPFFNDEFGDVYGNIYALRGHGFAHADLKRYAERVRAEVLRIPDVAKVEFFGEQDERVFIEFSSTKLATLGVDVQTITGALAAQNAIAASGAFHTATDRIFLRPSGDFDSIESIRETNIRAGGRVFRLADVADVHRGYVDPPQSKMRFQGEDAFGIGVSMAKGGDIIALGENLGQAVARIRSELPVGLELEDVSNQPLAVQRSINEFVRSLAEAIVIVLIVSFLSLGLRSGVVVALSIPLVLAATFLLMRIFDVGLHKISLGALVLALGLLVDDAIIAVEMMARKMEQGWDRARAASFAYASTAMPMLTGTLVTAAGFLPIATAQSATGEYTRSIFQVNFMALLLSWLAAVVFIPYLGYKLLPDPAGQGRLPLPLWQLRLRRLLRLKQDHSPKPSHTDADDAIYQTRFFQAFRSLLIWCVRRRWVVIITTIGIFGLALFGFGSVQQQFFPNSTRPELLVDLRLNQGASYWATEAAVKRLEAVLRNEPGIENFVAYVGTGSPRFYLPLDQQQPSPNFAQFVILTKGTIEREALRGRLIRLFDDDFPELRASINRLENGPPVGFPVQFRVSGPDIPTIRVFAEKIAGIMRSNPHLANVQFDWDEQTKVIRLEIDQAKARLLGVSSQDLAGFLNAALNGVAVTQYRERDQSIDVLLRGAPTERIRLSLLSELSVPTRAGKSVPLAQIARIHYEMEDGVIWRRDRLPTITVRANVYGNVQAPTVTGQIEPLLAPIHAELPFGYRIDVGGAVEDSNRGQASVAAGVPMFIAVVLTVLMIQLKSFQRVVLVVLTAPLGLIGVTAFLLVFNQPFGFVAMLGTIALTGMIMRNSVILVDQIDQDIAAGRTAWDAIIEATVRRFRPIVLTALAAVIAMVPLSRSAFFGPMAVAVMGGLIVATALTLLFLPALYAAWFRVRPPLG